MGNIITLKDVRKIESLDELIDKVQSPAAVVRVYANRFHLVEVGDFHVLVLGDLVIKVWDVLPTRTQVYRQTRKYPA